MRRGSMRWSTGRWSPVIGRMERRGIKVDRDYLAKLSGDFAIEIAALEERIYEAARRAVHHRLAAAAGRGAVRPARPEGRAQGQERPIFDRRQRARAAGRRGRRVRAAGARLAPADQAANRPIPTRCRRRSTRRPAGSTPASACRARRPGGCARTSPICRTSRSAPRSAARSATPSSPSRAMC